jgi:hypothetical protein
MRAPAVPYLETAAAGVWWTLGAAALSGGLSTVVLAGGLGITGALVVALRRRYGSGEPLPPTGRWRLLRLLVGAIVVIALAAVGLGYLGYAELTIPLAAVVVGVALLLMSPVLDDRAPVAAGAALMVLGAGGAVLALDSAGRLYPQGLVGLGAGALLWLFGAQRTGLLAELRERTRL